MTWLILKVFFDQLSIVIAFSTALLTLLTMRLVLNFSQLNLVIAIFAAILTASILYLTFKKDEDILNKPLKEEDKEKERSTVLDILVKAHEDSQVTNPYYRQSKDYFDVNDILLNQPDLAKEVHSRFVQALQSYPKAKVCFIEKNVGTGGMLTAASSIASGLGRPVSKFSLLRDVMPLAVAGGKIQNNDEVVIVQDILRTGYETVESTKKLRKMGVRVIAAIFLVDCEQQKKDDEFDEINISPISIFTLSEIQGHMKNRDSSTKP